MIDIYRFDDYRELLRAAIEKYGRGAHKRFSDAAGCQSSYLSQVLSESAHLTPDQAYGIAKDWRLDEEGVEYFTGMVTMERAANKNYRRYWANKLEKIRTQKNKLSVRLKVNKPISGENKASYYAQWYYPALHSLVAIPEFQSVSALTNRLGISKELTMIALRNLEDMGLIKSFGGRVEATSFTVHVNGDSPLNICYHNVWRNIANQRLQERPFGENCHYTSLYGISKKDTLLLKEMVLKFIESTRSVVAPSNQETLMCFNLDLFEV